MVTVPTWRCLPMHAQHIITHNIEIVCPSPSRMFRAFEMTPPEHTRVVILGQDPYHTPGKASGLAFGYHNDYKGKLDSSLHNILCEVERDTGGVRTDLTLESWAQQGVLLLNTRLSTLEGKPLAHAGLGWEQLIIKYLINLDNHVKDKVYLLWGKEAQSFRRYINYDKKNLVLETSHPCSLSAHRGFNGCGHFSQANRYLTAARRGGIEW